LTHSEQKGREHPTQKVNYKNKMQNKYNKGTDWLERNSRKKEKAGRKERRNGEKEGKKTGGDRRRRKEMEKMKGTGVEFISSPNCGSELELGSSVWNSF